jgi:hypothetical protein
MATAQGQQSFQATFQASPHFGHMRETMQRSIQECLSCFSICEQTLTHCLRKGGKYAAPEVTKVLVDSAESCRMTAAMMSRESDFSARQCMLCADICKACEEACENFGSDAQMKACSDACRSCADACRAMAAQA